MDTLVCLTPERWMQQLFSAKAVNSGGVLRRSTRDVERLVGRARFEREVRRRGFHLMECGDQFLIICNDDPLRILF